MDARRYMFIDTDATTTYQFSHYYHGRAMPELEQLAAETRDRYDLFFLCEPDIYLLHYLLHYLLLRTGTPARFVPVYTSQLFRDPSELVSLVKEF